MKKFLLIALVLASSVCYAENYYIVSGDAALEIYEREQLRQQQRIETFTRGYRERKEREIKEKERQIEELVKRY